MFYLTWKPSYGNEGPRKLLELSRVGLMRSGDMIQVKDEEMSLGNWEKRSKACWLGFYSGSLCLQR